MRKEKTVAFGLQGINDYRIFLVECSHLLSIDGFQKLLFAHHHRDGCLIPALCMAHHTQGRLLGRRWARFLFYQYVAVFVNYLHVFLFLSIIIHIHSFQAAQGASIAMSSIKSRRLLFIRLKF